MTKSKKEQQRNFFIYTPIFYGLLGVAFLNFYAGWLVIPAMLGIIWSFFHNWKQAKFVKVIWRSNILFLAIVMSWMLYVNPSSWSPLKGLIATVSVWFFYVLTVLMLSLASYIMAHSWVKIRTKVKLPSYNYIFIFTALWILMELARSYLFSLFMIGPGVGIAPHWNFGTLGIAQSGTFLLPLASTYGMYGLSVIAILLASLYESYKQGKRSFLIVRLMVFAMLVSGLILNSFYYVESDDKVQVSAVNIQSANLDYEDLLSDVEGQPVTDLLVLPEYSEIFDEIIEDESTEIRDQLLDKIADQDTVIITSRENRNLFPPTNQLVHFDADGAELLVQDKTFLIPGGEYLPYFSQPLLRAIKEDVILQHEAERGVTAGQFPEEPYASDFATIGSYACSGVISPELYRDMANKNAEILTNSASLTIFGNAQVYHQQNKSFAVFHAAANQKPFIQSTKKGVAYIIDHNGKIIEQDSTDSSPVSYISAEIQPTKSKTLFTRIGEVTIYFAVIYLLGLLIYQQKKGQKDRKN